MTKLKNKTRASAWQVAQLVLFACLPVVLFCAYHPVIVLGQAATMNFELSLPLIWLVVFDLCAVVNYLRWRRSRVRDNMLEGIEARQHHKSVGRHHTRDGRRWRIVALLAFPIYLTISCLWSANPIRGGLTVGIFWLVIGAVMGVIFLLYHTLREKSIVFPVKLAKLATHPSETFCGILLIASVVVAIWCWIQCLLDLVGVGREFTLMCEGCTTRVFGFPHPSGLAIEPQFMGGMLLAPALLALWLWQTRRSARYLLSALLLCSTLFLTFSRGAIYAFVVGLVVILIYQKVTQTQIKSARRGLVAIPVVAFCLTLVAQGAFAALGPTSDTFITGVTKSLHHLSLGWIDLRPTRVEELPSEIETIASVAPAVATDSDKAVFDGYAAVSADMQMADDRAVFDGYAAISTDVRIRLTDLALKVWQSEPQYTLVGVGLGGAGTVLYRYFPELGSPKEIVQNEYVSLLLETGILGYVTLGISLYALMWWLRRAGWLVKWRQERIGDMATKNSTTEKMAEAQRLMLEYWSGLVIANAVTICFFSGLPNALHIYLLTPIILILIYTKCQKVVK